MQMSTNQPSRVPPGCIVVTYEEFSWGRMLVAVATGGQTPCPIEFEMQHYLLLPGESAEFMVPSLSQDRDYTAEILAWDFFVLSNHDGRVVTIDTGREYDSALNPGSTDHQFIDLDDDDFGFDDADLYDPEYIDYLKN